MDLQDDTASAVLHAIAGASAVTLEGGYAVFVGIPGCGAGRRTFEPARMSGVRRNETGRCTRAVATYRDGSSLTFSWHPSRGHRYVRQAA